METKNESKPTSSREIKAEEEKSDSSQDVPLECTYCGNHPCFLRELEPLLSSIQDAFGELKTNKQIRFLMYKDSVKVIHGTGLDKGVRKRLPSCVQRHIHKLAPDDKYTGFIPSNDNN